MEHSSDVIIGITTLVPEYKSLALYDDLYENPFFDGDAEGKSKRFNNTSLYRKIKLMVPLYYIRRRVL